MYQQINGLILFVTSVYKGIGDYVNTYTLHIYRAGSGKILKANYHI